MINEITINSNDIEFNTDLNACGATAGVFASDLRLKPGQFPRFIVVPGVGNGQLFVARKRLADGGFTYRQDLGILKIDIYND